MSNVSMAGSHQVSISHDPIEEHETAGTNQLRRSSRDGWPSGGRRPEGRYAQTSSSSLQDMLPSINVADLRPALLAGAIGLFAAWVVSGMNAPRALSRSQGRPTRGGGYVPDRGESAGSRAPSRSATSFGVGPEGASSREDLSLDAMNP